MRILLDECVNPRLRRAFPTHDLTTIAEVGWLAIADSELIKLMQAKFDVFVTLDQGFAHQQNLANCSFGIVILYVRRNTLEFYEPIFNLILIAAETIGAGRVVHVGDSRRANQ